MILYELFDTEENQVYQRLETENLRRQYSFLASMVMASIEVKRRTISAALIRALNYHAVACLHVKAGEYRPCHVTTPSLDPPQFHRVPALMEHFIDEVNSIWAPRNSWDIAAYCLWRLNYIHPFINGNGRTARALCYYVICVNAGRILPGKISLPERMRDQRQRYVELLMAADLKYSRGDPYFLRDLRDFIMRLTVQQTMEE